jgi:prepilin-type N-terminal cleavage/methylation domain-containing protein
MHFNSQKGFSLVEVVASIALLAVVGGAILSGLGTGIRALTTTDEQETAKNIGELQVEYIKSLPYSNTYMPRDISSDYPSYSIVTAEDGMLHAEAVPDRMDGNIQRIEVVINHGTKQVLTVIGYKVR